MIEQPENAEKSSPTQGSAAKKLTTVSSKRAAGPQRLADLLAGGSLGNLAREAAQRRDLTERVRAVLPAEEAAHLVMASRNDAGELVLIMDSGAWAARARYLALAGQPVRVKVRPARE